MGNILFLVFLSFLPVFVFGLYVYNHDKDKDSKNLLFKLFLGGIGSTFIAVMLSMILKGIFGLSGVFTEMSLFQIIIFAFMVVGLSEEFSKWLFTYWIGYKSKYFDRPFEIIMYSVFVALGFAAFENLFYVLGNDTFGESVFVGVIRAFSAIPAHAIDGVFMGYFLSIAKSAEIQGNILLKRKNIILSILIPSILHGLYDFFLFSAHIHYIFIALFFVTLVVLYIIGIKKIKTISKVKERLFYVNNFCTNCGSKVVSDFCHVCGKKQI
jgi:RsiW-degrading membrane proteinase PrsW (M82 family)